MLKTVSSIVNAIGALNYKGTWNASANTPALASGTGTKGDYYVVSVAGSTTLDGISNWGIGDWATFNGSIWQRVEGGADLNGVNLTVSGTATLSGATASSLVVTNASKVLTTSTNTAWDGLTLSLINAGDADAKIELKVGGAGGDPSMKMFDRSANVNIELICDTSSADRRFDFYGKTRPGADNSFALGGPSNRWSVVYSATALINTSDEREKQDIAVLDEAEKRVALAVKGLVKKFRFKDSVVEKGDAARIHIGVIAQEIAAAFQAEGLDPMRYGIVCFDEWNEIPEIKVAELDQELKETGQMIIVQQYRPAGNRYGVRYEELLAFIIATL
jgi:hypothetical protein